MLQFKFFSQIIVFLTTKTCIRVHLLLTYYCSPLIARGPDALLYDEI